MLKHKWYGKTNAENANVAQDATNTLIEGAKVIAMSFARPALRVAA